MDPIIAIACGFCFGCLVAARYFYFAARREYLKAIQVTTRALQGMEKGHLLKVIEDEPLKEESTF